MQCLGFCFFVGRTVCWLKLHLHSKKAFSLSLCFVDMLIVTRLVLPLQCVQLNVTVVAVCSSLHQCLAAGVVVCSCRGTDCVAELTNSTIQRFELNAGH